jgi:hypothetical protein
MGLHMNMGHVKRSVFQIVIDVPEVGPLLSNEFEKPVGKILKMIDGVVYAQGGMPATGAAYVGININKLKWWCRGCRVAFGRNRPKEQYLFYENESDKKRIKNGFSGYTHLVGLLSLCNPPKPV